MTIAKRAPPELPDAAGNNDFLYTEVLEPAVSNGFAAVGKVEQLRILLVESKSLCGFSHLMRYF